MPKLRPLQQSFTAGELSPRLLSRSDLAGYAFGVQEMTNFVCTPHGPAARRNGSTMIWWDEDGDNGTFGRMFDFNVSYSEAFIVLVLFNEIIILDRNGIKNAGNPLTDPGFIDGGTSWNPNLNGPGVVTFNVGTCELDGGVTAAQWVEISSLANYADAGTGDNEQFIRVNKLTPGSVEVLIGTAEGLGDILTQTVSGLSPTISFTPGVDTFWVTIRAYGDQPTQILDFIDLTAISAGTGEVRFPNTIWTTKQAIDDIHVAMPPGEDVMYMTSRFGGTVHKITKEGDVWTFEEVSFDFGSGTQPWSLTPGSIDFFQGRMWLAGSLDNPAGIWASVPGEYENFDIGDATQETDALDFELRTRGDIQWLRATKQLHVGTGRNENTLKSDGPIIIAEDADSDQESVIGSSRIHAKDVHDGISWISANGRKLYGSNYDDNRRGWVPVDLTYPSEHITSPGVTELELAISPDNIMWMPTIDGRLVGFSYEPSQEAAGWHKHDTQGQILSVCITEELGYSVGYLLVLREVDGEQRLMVERQSRDVYMDSAFQVEFEDPTDTVTGLDHLEGQTVQVLVDDAIHPDLVVENGEITTEWTGTRFVVGLQYTAVLRTMPIDVLTQSESITSRRKRWNQIYVRLLDSARPIINGDNPRQRTPATPMGVREPNKTEDIKVANLGWDEYGSIEIVQELPFKTEVLGIFGELAAEGL